MSRLTAQQTMGQLSDMLRFDNLNTDKRLALKEAIACTEERHMYHNALIQISKEINKYTNEKSDCGKLSQRITKIIKTETE